MNSASRRQRLTLAEGKKKFRTLLVVCYDSTGVNRLMPTRVLN